MLDRYANHPSVVGYYLSTEWIPSAFDSDPSEPRERSAAVARFIKQRRPNLKTVMPIGLYNIVVDGHWTRMTPDFLETFWGSWAEVEEIDAYMIIDGVGTGLSSLVHTDACQAWARQFCDRYGKELWVDVECADMPPYQPLPIDRLIPSVEVAARYADVIVVFDYIYYMDHGVAQPAARELHESYAQYRQHYLATHPARRRTPLHFRPDFEPGT
jgi:hypothetical protein